MLREWLVLNSWESWYFGGHHPTDVILRTRGAAVLCRNVLPTTAIVESCNEWNHSSRGYVVPKDRQFVSLHVLLQVWTVLQTSKASCKGYFVSPLFCRRGRKLAPWSHFPVFDQVEINLSELTWWSFFASTTTAIIINSKGFNSISRAGPFHSMTKMRHSESKLFMNVPIVDLLSSPSLYLQNGTTYTPRRDDRTRRDEMRQED
jgi:hypothetical protein